MILYDLMSLWAWFRCSFLELPWGFGNYGQVWDVCLYHTGMVTGVNISIHLIRASNKSIKPRSSYAI